jgi:two-component system response regulator YesN
MFKAIIVDDEPMAREAVKIATEWEEYGFYIAAECENGQDALAAIREHKPDLVVTDIRMPDMDGLELIEKARESMGDDMRFILVSGYDDFDYAKKALKLGIRHYIVKPVFSEEFSDVLMEVLYDLEQREELKRIEKERQDNESAIFFERLLAGNMSQETIRRDWPPRIPLENMIWACAILDIQPGGTWSSQGGMCSYEDIKRELQSLSDDTRYVFAIFPSNSPYVFLILGSRENSIDPLAENLKSLLRSLYPEGFYLAVSNPTKDPLLLPKCRKEAELTLEYKFFSCPGSVMFFRDVEGKSLSYRFGDIQYINALIKELDNLDADGARSTMERLFAFFRETYTAPGIVAIYVINIVYHCMATLRNMGGDACGLPQIEKASRLASANLSLDEMESLLRDYAQRFLECAGRLKSHDPQSIMSKIEEYIKGNFTRSLTIREIAEKFYLHPTYLGCLINQWFGCGFNEYIHKLRMERAKALLAESDMKLHEIAAALGYGTYGYFLDQFYRTFQMRPTDFRNRIRGGE